MADVERGAEFAGGCREQRLLLSRRTFLGMSAALFTSAWLPSRSVLASTGSDPRLLVVILRGGVDGLNTVVPYAENDYVVARGGLALTEADTLALPAQADWPAFRLNAALQQFQAWYLSGEASIVQAVCVPLKTRSHFDCQDNLENGLPGLSSGSTATGWMNRLLGAVPSTSLIHPSLHGGVALGEAPLILRGPAPYLGWSSNWLDKMPATVAARAAAIYKAIDPAMHRAYTQGTNADGLATSVTGIDFGDAEEDVSWVRQSFRGAGRLLRHEAGPRIGAISIESFDTHSNQGTVKTPNQRSFLYDKLVELDNGLKDFRIALGEAAWAETVVLCVTEFGRSLHSNGAKDPEDGGTDHGAGSVALLAGGAVDGGKMLGEWPGLGAAELHEGLDLKATLDMRSLFKSVLHDHMKVTDSVLETVVFPGSAAAAPRVSAILPEGALMKPVQSASLIMPAREGTIGAPAEPLTGIAAFRRQFGTVSVA